MAALGRQLGAVDVDLVIEERQLLVEATTPGLEFTAMALQHGKAHRHGGIALMAQLGVFLHLGQGHPGVEQPLDGPDPRDVVVGVVTVATSEREGSRMPRRS